MRVSDLASILRDDGLRWLTFRLWYEVQLRFGFRLTLPSVPSIRQMLVNRTGKPDAQLAGWLVDQWKTTGGRLPEVQNQPGTENDVSPTAQADADRIVRGELRFFSREWRTLGHPPDWFRGAGGKHWPSDMHWSALPDLSPELGDIKHVWEPSRFSQTFSLVRAYAYTGDERYPEAFWSQVESWIEANRPELGPNWRCAQEMSLRTIAWIFGLYGFRNSPSSRPERVARLIEQLWYHAYHVEKVHWYAAECVRNNHAISEAVGLFTIGTLFPYLPDAKRWQVAGLRYLERELSWQVYEDGTYIQSSMNYARLVVQLLTWTIAVAKANQVALPAVVTDRAAKMLRFLVAVQEPKSGRVPNYGSNDGALILPLSSCDFLDYRPALQALSLALEQGRLFGPGPWDEEALLLLGPGSQDQPVSALQEAWAAGEAFQQGGYYTLRGEASHAVTRCTTYRHRPGQADMLHVDLWYYGQNILIDPGTFSYNLRPPWAGYFVGTAAHNTVSVDGRDQMRKGARFMWFHWTKGALLRFSGDACHGLFEGEHYGYSPVIHRRTVSLLDGVYVVVDNLENTGDDDHSYRLHWLLNDLPMQRDITGATIIPTGMTDTPMRITILTDYPADLEWARADEDTPRGWQSLYYGERQPAWSLACTIRRRTARFVTCIGPADRVGELSQRCSDDLEVLVKLARSGGPKDG